MGLKGNKFWKLRSKHGRDKLFAEPHLLKEACEEYFEWVEDNPLEEERIFSFQGHVNKGTVEKLRAMTIEGLCIFLDINKTTWYEWRKKTDNDLSNIVAWADDVMRNQKLTGAAADMLNANIIARELNLADSSEVKLTEVTEEVDDEDLDALTDEEFEEYERLTNKVKPKTKGDTPRES